MKRTILIVAFAATFSSLPAHAEAYISMQYADDSNAQVVYYVPSTSSETSATYTYQNADVYQSGRASNYTTVQPGIPCKPGTPCWEKARRQGLIPY
jgi:hypothetical protein